MKKTVSTKGVVAGIGLSLCLFMAPNKGIAQCPAGVNFTYSSPLCTNTSISFTNTSTIGTDSTLYTYFWEFDRTGNGGVTPSTSTFCNPNCIYTQPSNAVGTYDVRLTITEIAGGCTNRTTKTIWIGETPVSSFVTSAPDCISNPISFNNTGSSGGGFTYNWTFGANSSPATSTSQNPNSQYSVSGPKVVSFTITSGSGCGSTVSTQTINMYDDADATFTSSSNFACVGQPVIFYDASTDPVELVHTWNFGTGASPTTSTLQNPAPVTYTASSSETITHIVSNGPGSVGCANSTQTQVIAINPVPTSSFTSNAPQCEGSAVNFTNAGTTGTGITYAWDFGSGATPATSVAQNESGVQYATAGTKTVSLITKNQFGCSTTDIASILINSTPAVNFISSAPQCTGLPVNFTSAGPSSGVTWFWNFGSGATPATSTLQSPTGVVYSTAGAKLVQLTITNTTTGCSKTGAIGVSINQTPTATFTSTAPQCAGMGVNFTNTGSTGTSWSYSWSFGQNALPA
ncbi:MAG: PKD domain-containing protein, partial [Bacteroidia bacterium]